MRQLILGTGAVILLGGCTGPAGPLEYRGQFALVTTRSMPDFAEIGSQPRVFSRECFGWAAWLGGSDDAISAAVEAAISQRADANALVLVEIRDAGRCIEVEGWPVRHE